MPPDTEPDLIMTANDLVLGLVDGPSAMSHPDPLADPESPAVVAAAQVGDRAALTTIYVAYRQRIADQLRRLIDDPSAVDDLVQEVFIAAFAGLRRFRGDARISSWLHVIAVNVARRRWRLQRRRQYLEVPLGDLSDRAPWLLTDADLDLQQRLCLLGELKCLPESLREAFIARAIDGLDLREASIALDIPVSTVSWRTRRAQRVLCERLGLPIQDR